MVKAYFDVLIVAPLDEEFEAIQKTFPIVEDFSTESSLRFRVEVTHPDTRVLLVKQSMMGKTAAQAAVNSALDDFEVGLVVCLGIAGALSKDLNIGDVCFSKSIVDVSDNAKVFKAASGADDIAFSPTHYETPVELVTAIDRNMHAPSYKAQVEKWKEEALSEGKRLIPEPFTGKGNALETVVAPKVCGGLIAHGSVSASSTYREKLQSLDRKILAIETESGGVFSAAKPKKVPALTVRGISDYADCDKTRFEQETGGNARALAINNAAKFLLVQMESEFLRAWLFKQRDQRGGAIGQVPPFPPAIVDVVGDAIHEQHASFHERLRELQPAYALQTKGYRLPVPRVRLGDNRSGSTERVWGDPQEVRDALKVERVLVLAVPKDYPDKALSWMLAADLLEVHLNDRQVVSAVVEAASLRRPKFGFDKLLPGAVTALSTNPDVQLVIFIDDFRFDSKSKTDFLLEQVKKFPEARFVIVTRSRSSVLAEDTFSGRAGAALAQLDDVSFAEIAHFLQKNFDLNAIASEVVASRLRETFSKFDLSAHPSYFAGIPKDTLDKLLNANRRGELIDLAVAGYLSFLVASDDAEVVLSRTTREKFLSDLAYALNVDKQEFSEGELVSYVEKIAAEFDYGVSAAGFVASFVAKGILHFEDNRVRFTLPFIESYLLAKRLVVVPDVAKEYFSIGDPGIDLRTFTLYAELGASQQIIQSVLKELEFSVEQLSKGAPSTPILLGGFRMPALLAKPERLSAIQKSVSTAIADVRADMDQSRKKQSLLDATDRIREGATKQSLTSDGGREISDLERAQSVWIASVNLLGAGAERLDAGVKRKLISDIVRLACQIVDGWTRQHLNVDFSALKVELLSDPKVISALSKSESEADLADARLLAGNLVDLMEFVWIATPFRRTMETLCEEAREKVLVESLANSVVSGDMDKLVHGIWLADVASQKGKKELTNAIKQLPDAHFLRVLIATHLMTRVYWKHWNKGDRLELLDAASEMLQGVGFAVDQGKIRRQIEREVKEEDGGK